MEITAATCKVTEVICLFGATLCGRHHENRRAGRGGSLNENIIKKNKHLINPNDLLKSYSSYTLLLENWGKYIQSKGVKTQFSGRKGVMQDCRAILLLELKAAGVHGCLGTDLQLTVLSRNKYIMRLLKLNLNFLR